MWECGIPAPESANAFQKYRLQAAGKKSMLPFLIQILHSVTAAWLHHLVRQSNDFWMNSYRFLRKAGSGTCKVASHRDSLKLLWRQACHPWPAKLLQALQISGSSSNLKWLSKGQIEIFEILLWCKKKSPAAAKPKRNMAAFCGIQAFSHTQLLHIPDLSTFLPVDVIVLSFGNVFLSLVEPKIRAVCNSEMHLCASEARKVIFWCHSHWNQKCWYIWYISVSWLHWLHDRKSMDKLQTKERESDSNPRAEIREDTLQKGIHSTLLEIHAER